MSAGMSTTQIYSAIFYRLHKIQRQLTAKGYLCHYENKALYTGTQFQASDKVAWYTVSRASNGETFGTFHAIPKVKQLIGLE